MKNILLFFLCIGSFATIGAKPERHAPSGRFERATLPSESTAADMTGRTNESATAGGSLRGAGNDLPEPGPIGGGLGIVMLCSGAYLLNIKKNRK
ncbi:MAG: hypothetical protein LBS25_09710 [Candidatus Symbiothrix sp.]|jgi:hypothetical protein|nr:hypothetical protein [Candidatus Symbiothrix sp.]